MDVQSYYQLANFSVALGLLAAALAIAVGVARNCASQYRFVSILLFCFFGCASFGRFLKAANSHGVLETTVDALTGLCALLVGGMLWYTLKKTFALPTYEQIESTNAALAEKNKQLEQQQHLFDAYMENSPAVSFLEDEEARLVYVNRAFEEQLHVKREQIIGFKTALWAPPETAHAIIEQNKKARSENRPIAQMIDFPSRPGGPPEPWIVVRFPMHGHFGGASIGGIALNMTAQYETAHLNSKLASIVECSQDAIIGLDLHGTIINWNRGAEELYGYSTDEVVGRDVSMLVPTNRVNEIPEFLDKVRRDIRLHDYETKRLCKKGQEKDVSESVSPIRDGGGTVVGAAVIARDISVFRRQQHDIKSLNDELQKRVYELAESNAALQTARDQALEASNLKSSFVANISHEIRTPLSGILGLNELLLASVTLTEDDKQLAELVNGSAKALLSVVNDILDLSKIEAGKVTLEYRQFDPVELVESCTNLMYPTAQQKGLEYKLTIDSKVPHTAFGDASRVRQVLLNLIGNAVKFTQAGSITVHVYPVHINANEVVLEFSIADTGIGISPDEQKMLYMPFAQVDNSNTRKFGGTGLGLSISKSFVEMMGGQISLRSQKGMGSTFIVRLPFNRTNTQLNREVSSERLLKPVVEPIPPALATGRAVLLVEDSPVLQHLAMRHLNALRIYAEVTPSGREAVELALSGRFDIILMDVNLPDMTGLEAAAAIRNLEQSGARLPVPIIAMTAGAMAGDKERAIDAGMNDYLAKPVAIELLKRTIETWLSKAPVRITPPYSPSERESA